MLLCWEAVQKAIKLHFISKYQPVFAKAKGAKLDKPKELEVAARASFEVVSNQITKVENASADQNETQPSQVVVEPMQKPSIKTKA